MGALAIICLYFLGVIISIGVFMLMWIGIIVCSANIIKRSIYKDLGIQPQYKSPMSIKEFVNYAHGQPVEYEQTDGNHFTYLSE